MVFTEKEPLCIVERLQRYSPCHTLIVFSYDFLFDKSISASYSYTGGIFGSKWKPCTAQRPLVAKATIKISSRPISQVNSQMLDI